MIKTDNSNVQVIEKTTTIIYYRRLKNKEVAVDNFFQILKACFCRDSNVILPMIKDRIRVIKTIKEISQK